MFFDIILLKYFYLLLLIFNINTVVNRFCFGAGTKSKIEVTSLSIGQTDKRTDQRQRSTIEGAYERTRHSREQYRGSSGKGQGNRGTP